MGNQKLPKRDVWNGLEVAFGSQEWQGSGVFFSCDCCQGLDGVMSEILNELPFFVLPRNAQVC
ncbi:MAG TPA: hypothetical protein VF607_07365 [Verrucomicrobiae bacterium]